ncbi:hypothetical protein [Leclercia tamurae]|uniref:hypothetical protein n=1 Tax=Leclercia tamurae TaxID=2926467 RepID=UPI0036F46AE5
MSYIKRRDAFFVVMVVIGAVAYFSFDIDTSSLGWPLQMGIFGCGMSLYLAFVQIPTIGDELEKQREINEKLNDKINDLKDQLRYSGNK